jgi:hypothetical protein
VDDPIRARSPLDPGILGITQERSNQLTVATGTPLAWSMSDGHTRQDARGEFAPDYPSAAVAEFWIRKPPGSVR